MWGVLTVLTNQFKPLDAVVPSPRVLVTNDVSRPCQMSLRAESCWADQEQLWGQVHLVPPE